MLRTDWPFLAARKPVSWQKGLPTPPFFFFCKGNINTCCKFLGKALGNWDLETFGKILGKGRIKWKWSLSHIWVSGNWEHDITLLNGALGSLLRKDSPNWNPISSSQWTGKKTEWVFFPIPEKRNLKLVDFEILPRGWANRNGNWLQAFWTQSPHSLILLSRAFSYQCETKRKKN